MMMRWDDVSLKLAFRKKTIYLSYLHGQFVSFFD
jgi:hypothetical protein